MRLKPQRNIINFCTERLSRPECCSPPAGRKNKICDAETREKIEKIVSDSGFDAEIKEKLNYKKILSLMQKDKKSVSKKIKFVLPSKIGRITARIEVDDKIVLSAIKECLNEKKYS
jgi:3-dehydroquinate synthetase